MDNKFIQFIAAYQNANQSIKDIIDSEQIGLDVDKILTDSNYVAFKPQLIILSANLLLEIISEEELLNSLIVIGIDPTAAQNFFNVIKQNVTTYKNSSAAQQTITPIADTQTPPTYNNPLVQPLPQSPYAEVPTYQSSQADIYPIRKRPGTDDPKWERSKRQNTFHGSPIFSNFSFS